MTPAKTAEPIEMPFGLWTRVIGHRVAHWRNLVNTIELTMLRAAAMRPYVKLLHLLSAFRQPTTQTPSITSCQVTQND